jgi:RNA polymerase sigma-70 factor (ECF subfamily)
VTDETSVRLLALWRAGDQQAATELFHRYAERLIALAQRRLSARLAVRVDPDDIIQSAYSSFFIGARDGRFVLQRSGDLWRLLVRITLNKLNHQVEHHTAEKRTITAEQPFADDDGPLGLPSQLLVHEPTPADAVVLAATLDEVLGRLDPAHRRMVELRLQGYSLAEIEAETHRSRATIGRALQRVKEQLGMKSGDATPNPEHEAP